MKKQFQTMKKWLIAFTLFVSASTITCFFADRAGPNGIVIDNQYYHWEDVAFVKIHLSPTDNKVADTVYDFTGGNLDWRYIPNGYFQYRLVMKNGVSINVFDWFGLSNTVALDRHVRKLGIKVVHGEPFDHKITADSKEQLSSDEFTIKKTDKSIKVLYKDNLENLYEEVYQSAEINAEYKKRYTAIFTGQYWHNAALTEEQKQMLISIFKR